MTQLASPSLDATLADLATTHPGAARVFWSRGLDFCCHGQISLAEACHARGLDAPALADELAALAPEASFELWDWKPLPLLVLHLLERYHARHRADLPALVALAHKVERVHADKPTVPRGLAELLARVTDELEQHMQKEEQVLFPLILAGRGRMAAMPVQAMEREHEDHGRNLAALRALTHDHVAPPEACNTWRALYFGLASLERELMQHIHLENNVLFPRALRA